ncbi:MAG: hypothetical protein ACD_47C00211G0001 [uncultured bacterium]|nr:MAG: hypothetical protein ACD_47C00211G0001 [uncultured bacterium]
MKHSMVVPVGDKYVFEVGGKGYRLRRVQTVSVLRSARLRVVLGERRRHRTQLLNFIDLVAASVDDVEISAGVLDVGDVDERSVDAGNFGYFKHGDGVIHEYLISVGDI